uniref:RNase III domain-containing protein n=1 Tax=Timema shepardi TaxID=629360 RepID=A0A7R9FVF5_TIMSH|nr:unnamed protein product [Timema shepardi]
MDIKQLSLCSVPWWHAVIVDCLQTKTPTIIHYDEHEFIFEGFSMFSHFPLEKLPTCKVIRFNIEYMILYVEEKMPESFSIRQLDLFYDYIFHELLELVDLDFRAHDDKEGCPQFHFMPRFSRDLPDNGKEILSMNEVMRYLINNGGPLIDETKLAEFSNMPQFQWQNFADEIKGYNWLAGMVVTYPGMKPCSLRVDQLDRDQSKNDQQSYPEIVHFGIRPPQLSYAGNLDYQGLYSLCASYQKAWRDYVKFRHLLANMPKPSFEDKRKLECKEIRLQEMRTQSKMKRDVTVAVSAKGFYRTGIMCDVVQHAMLIPVLVCHLRFHRSCDMLEKVVSYKFKNRFILQLALTHPSYSYAAQRRTIAALNFGSSVVLVLEGNHHARGTEFESVGRREPCQSFQQINYSRLSQENFGTNPDHARNTLTNCGIRQPEYGDRRIHYMNTRKRGENKLKNQLFARFGGLMVLGVGLVVHVPIKSVSVPKFVVPRFHVGDHWHTTTHASIKNIGTSIETGFIDTCITVLTLAIDQMADDGETGPQIPVGCTEVTVNIQWLHSTQGINTLINIMSRFGKKEETQSNITHNERLEFLGDAVVEFLTSIHLFHMFPDLEEGGLATYRAALVQNQHLAVLAKVLNLDQFMLYAHGSDLCHDLELRHAMANCFEAFMGALFLDGGIQVPDHVFSETMFKDQDVLLGVWKNYPPHPLQEQEPAGDRKWIKSFKLLQKLTEFEENIGVQFTHIRLLARAFTDRSIGYTNLTL